MISQMPNETTPPTNPVGYLITCQVAAWEGQSAVVINQGGPPALGYSIWSRDDMDRVIGELQTASAKAWPVLIEYEIDPNNPPPLTDEQKDELARIKAAQDREDESDARGPT